MDTAVYQDGRRVHVDGGPDVGQDGTPDGGPDGGPHSDPDGALAGALDLMGRRPGSFLWIGLHEPTTAEFDLVEDRLDLHPRAAADAVLIFYRLRKSGWL